MTRLPGRYLVYRTNLFYPFFWDFWNFLFFLTWKQWLDLDQFLYFIIHKMFELSLSYLRMKSDELFSKAELFEKFGQKSSK